MGLNINLGGSSGGSSPRWYRILVDLAIIAMCSVLLFRTVPQQRLLVLPFFGLGIAVGGINLFKELRQIYKERAGEDEPKTIRFCPYCGSTLYQNSETCNNCGKKLPK